MLRPVVVAALALWFAGEAPAAAGTPGENSEIERLVGMPADQKIAYAADALREVMDSIRSAERLAESASDSKEKTDCISGRLTSLRSLAGAMQPAYDKMVELAASGQKDAMDHYFRLIAIGLGKARQVSAEIERCDDGDTVADGDTIVVREPGTPDDANDVGEPGTTDMPDISFPDPPEESPFY